MVRKIKDSYIFQNPSFFEKSIKEGGGGPQKLDNVISSKSS
jgi:hypothetical protein